MDHIVAALRLLDRSDEALSRAESWLAQHPPTAFLLTEMGICHGNLGSPDRARASASTRPWPSSQRASPPSTSSSTWSCVPTRPGRDAAARAWLERGAPASPRVLNLAGLAAERSGDTARARELYDRAAALEPDNPAITGKPAGPPPGSGNPREAWLAGQKAIERHPQHPRLLNLTGVAAFERGRYEDAVRLYQRALQADPRNPYICGNLLQALHELKEFLEAVRMGEHWRAKPENRPNGYFLRWLALNHYGLNRKEQAFTILRQTDPQDREYGQAMRTMASLLNHEGRHTESLELLSSLPQGALDPVGTHYEYSRAYRELGMHDAAVENARRAVELSPDSVDCAQLYLRSLRSAKDIDTGERFAAEWIARHGEHAEILTYQGCFAHDRGDYERAAEITRRAMLTDPGFEPAARYLVKSLMALGRNREARSTAESWLQENKPSPELQDLLDQIKHLTDER
jgi:tetratricopeptide (TPR) repeat protein